MEKIVITGLKGAGKSTVAVLLANDFARQGKTVMLVDLSIDKPSLCSLLGIRPEAAEKIDVELPEFDRRACNKCGSCMPVCMVKAIKPGKDDYPEIMEDVCTGCGDCSVICPRDAIKMEKSLLGTVFFNAIKGHYFVVGGILEALGREKDFIREVKKFAIGKAKETRSSIMIIDAAQEPKNSFIPSLSGADMAYIISEPSLEGASDTQMIKHILDKMGIEWKLLLNKSERKIAKSKTGRTLYEHELICVPFSNRLRQAYRRGGIEKYHLAGGETKKIEE